MCGIFGYVGERGDAAELVLSGLRELEYRGYDSWGVAVACGGRAAVEKRVGKIGSSSTTLPSSTSGLGHTRWATHGGVTVENAHPHHDCTDRLAIAHNGIVANDVELRSELLRAGHRFRSETDSELIAHLIEAELEHGGPGDDLLIRATLAAFRRLAGLNAIAVLDARSGAIAAVKSGSPLVLGSAAGARLLASDASALLDHTRELVFLGEGQAALLERTGARLFDAESGAELPLVSDHVAWTAPSADRGAHADYMSKEIHEQPALLSRAAAGARPHAQTLAAAIADSPELFLIGCGSAGYAALAAQYLFARLGRHATAVAASEFGYLAAGMGPGALVVALSQSGETIDVLEAARAARQRGARIAALTNVEGSALWRLADLKLPLGVGPERCVLATKSLTAKLAFMLLTAHALRGTLDAGAALVERAAQDIAGMLQGERRSTLRAVATVLDPHAHLFVLGRGTSHALACETALKIKEVSYLHAEGFAGGELKHGVIALIEPGTPCIAIAPNDETRSDILAAAMQVKARGACVIGLAPERHAAFDHHIEVADLGEATAIANAVPAQLLGYDLACLRGHDPDMPRNLAKSVTVK